MADDLRDLVVDIYDTIADPARWSGVLDQVSKGLGARGCIIFEMNGLGEGRRIAAPYRSGVYQAELLDAYLSEHGATELADQDIAVNCVTPAAARTRIFDQMKQEHIDYMLSKIPRERFLELDEAAAMIAWLCSRENSFTTGGVFDLSGGRATY